MFNIKVNCQWIASGSMVTIELALFGLLEIWISWTLMKVRLFDLLIVWLTWMFFDQISLWFWSLHVCNHLIFWGFWVGPTWSLCNPVTWRIGVAEVPTISYKEYFPEAKRKKSKTSFWLFILSLIVYRSFQKWLGVSITSSLLRIWEVL